MEYSPITVGNLEHWISCSAFKLERVSLAKLLHMRLKTLLAMLFSGSIHTWNDMLSDVY